MATEGGAQITPNQKVNLNLENQVIYARWIETITDYYFTENYQTFIAPIDGAYMIELWGAEGGNYEGYKSGEYEIYEAGKGAYTVGTIELIKGENLSIVVGGKGNLASATEIITSGGYNGGGGSYYSAGTGGGATDIRYNGNTLNDRIMVAAGGGGSGAFALSVFGGAGGTLIGVDGGSYTSETKNNLCAGKGGTQIAGGEKGDLWTGEVREDTTSGTDGEFGIGGNGGYELKYEHGSGAGGGGYYGGGGGTERNGGGAGGSSYISGHQGCIAITSATNSTPLIETTDTEIDISYSYHYSGKIFEDTEMLSGNDSMPTHDGTTTMVGNTGDGYAKITLLEIN